MNLHKPHRVNKTANAEDKLKYKTFLTHTFNNDDYEVFSGTHTLSKSREKMSYKQVYSSHSRVTE